MRRVVITGIGIVSSIGNHQTQVLQSLRQRKSALCFNQSYADIGLKSHVSALVDIQLSDFIERKYLRFMGDAAGFAAIALQQAIADAGLEPHQVSNPKTGLFSASAGMSSRNHTEVIDIVRSKGVKKIGPFRVPSLMTSTTSACLSVAFGIQGQCLTISSACAASTDCIGQAYQQIAMGNQDIMFAGGGEEEHWSQTVLFDAMGALSTRFNDCPEKASRAYDKDRDGFVIANGAGMIVLESLDAALARGATVYAEVVGYGTNSSGNNMSVPCPESAARCIKSALANTQGNIDYINTHATSTKAGDIAELRALQLAMGSALPPLSSLKSLTGHSLGASGAQEIIYCLLMMKHDFIAASSHIECLDPDVQAFPVAQNNIEHTTLHQVLKTSFGFGGTNAALVLKKYS